MLGGIADFRVEKATDTPRGSYHVRHRHPEHEAVIKLLFIIILPQPSHQSVNTNLTVLIMTRLSGRPDGSPPTKALGTQQADG